MAKVKEFPFSAPEIPSPDGYGISLHCTENGSDKVYNLTIREEHGGYVVYFANGPRLGTIKPAKPPSGPHQYEKARQICNAQIAEKVSRGYNPAGGGVQLQDVRPADSGYRPQLSTALTDAESLNRVLADSRWVAQIKHNGERRMVRKVGETVTGINKKGQVVPLPESLVTAMRDIPSASIFIDAEQIGETLHVFDVLEINGKDLRQDRFTDRAAILQRVCANADGEPIPGIEPSHTAVGEAEKRHLLKHVQIEGLEGLVFKRASAPYAEGNRSQASLKYKIWNSLSAIVSNHNDKRSVGLSLRGPDGSDIPVGNVTVPSNAAMPPVGAVIEVEYQYAYQNGSLFTPKYLGQRNDVDPDECVSDQRVYKPEGKLAPRNPHSVLP